MIDTNILVYAADRNSEFHTVCRQFIDDCRLDPSPTFLTWGICYEFLRIATHPSVFRFTWTSSMALDFIDDLISDDGFHVLTETDQHLEFWDRVVQEQPELRGSIMHDVHTAVLMREHGISRICSRDSDFYRFPFLTVVDPLRG